MEWLLEGCHLWMLRSELYKEPFHLSRVGRSPSVSTIIKTPSEITNCSQKRTFRSKERGDSTRETSEAFEESSRLGDNRCHRRIKHCTERNRRKKGTE